MCKHLHLNVETDTISALNETCLTLPEVTPVSVHKAVLSASLWSYLAGGEEVTVAEDCSGEDLSSWPDLLLPRLRRAEKIETEETLDTFDLDRSRRFREAGLDVWALVPLAAVGRAHEYLTDAVDRIQPWWIESGRVRFGEPRLP